MAEGNFGTVINCMDGRTQLPLNEWMRKTFGVKYVDTITEPGPNGILFKGDEFLTDSIRKRVDISVNGHGSNVIVLVGHYGCAGTPGPRKMQDEHTMKGINVVKSWDLDARILGVYVGEDWKVQVIYDSEGEM